MNKLFMAVLGGNCGDSNIEVHDVRFVVGETIDQCIPELRRQWFGDAKGLHLDSYTELTHIDGYDIEVTSEENDDAAQLFFINVGGYRANKCLEFHDIGLFVADTEAAAKKQALSSLLQGYEETHRDDVYQVDNCLRLSNLGAYHVKLTPVDRNEPLRPTWFGYRPIDKDV